VLTALAIGACSFDTSGVSDVDGAVGGFDAQLRDGALTGDGSQGTNAVRRVISITPPTLVTPVSDFPVAVELSGDASLRDNASADGADILFTLTDGTPLFAEVVGFNQATGDLLAWVKVPAIAGPIDLHLYYGEGNVAPTNTLQQVWAAADVVWHLERVTATATLDSSGNGNDGTTTAPTAPIVVPGIHGLAADFDDGDEIFRGDSSVMNPGTDSFTVSVFFMEQNGLAGRDLVFYKGGYGSNTSNPGFDLEMGTGNWYANMGDGQDYVQSAFGSESELGMAWHHLAMVVDRGGQQLIAYVDGTSITKRDISAVGSVSTNISPRVGDTANSIDGVTDEFRYYPSARSPEWIALEAANGMDGSFMAIGAGTPAAYPMN
jgi:hypothetical protein